MNGVLERTLGVLELLARNGQGLELGAIAQALAIPRSAVHRLLSELVRCGYVRQLREHGDYLLTTKLVMLGLGFLNSTGIVDMAQPLLDRLADTAGELVRLAVIDEQQLTWVARAQGARQGLRYDPDMGSTAPLSCSATGHAWLMALDDEAALALVARSGLGARKDFGPQAPTSLKALQTCIKAARQRGFSLTQETYTPGLNALAAPVRLPGRPPLGVVSIAGPSARLTEARMLELGPALLRTAADLAQASSASPFFNRSSR